MSRTIRRKRHKTQYQHCSNHDVNDVIWVQDDNWGYSLNDLFRTWRTSWKQPKRRLEGKEYRKAWWEFHRDDNYFGSNYRWSWRNAAERRSRGRNKDELEKFWKNPEYEVMPVEPECLSWWW